MRNPARAVLVGGVLLGGVLVGAWCFVARSTPPALPQAPTDASESAVAQAAVAVDLAREPLLRGRRTLTGDERSLRVRVLSPAGRGVPARVNVFVPSGQADPALQTEEAVRLSRDGELWLARFGQALVADAEGRAALPLPELSARGSLHLCARHGDAFVETFVPVSEAVAREHVLALAVDRGFDVVLIDHAGAAVADVTLVAQWVEHDETFGRDAMRRRPLGRTDTAGYLRAAHAQAWRSQVLPTAGSARVTIGAELPGLDGQGAEVDLEHLAAEPVVVRLPPLGAIVVEVADEPPPGSRATLHLTSHAPSVRPAAHDLAIDAEGRGRWPRVALGQQWHVRLSPIRLGQAVVGPVREGETVTVRLASPEPLAISGRLWLGEQPLASGRLGYHVRLAQGWQGNIGVTDVEGRFRLKVAGASPGQRVALHLRCDRPGQGEGAHIAGVAGLTLLAGTTDVGDLHLVPAPLVVAGRLIGDTDRSETSLWITTDAGADVPLPRVTVDAAGRFVCYDRPPSGALALAVYSPRHQPVPKVPFAVGQRDVEIELQAGASLQADYVVNDPVAFITLAPRLTPRDGGGRSALVAPGAAGTGADLAGFDRACPYPRRPDIVVDDPMTFRYVWHGLPPGRYRLDMLGYGQDVSLHSADVDLRAGEPHALAAVDLRASVRHVRVRLTNPPETEPGPRAALGYLFALRGDVPQAPGMAFDGAVAFVAVRDRLDLRLDVKGCRRQVLRAVADHVEVTLQPGIPVRIRAQSSAGDGQLEFDTTPCDPPTTAFSPASGGVAVVDMATRAEPDADTFVVRVCAEGTYRLTAQLRDRAGFHHACAVEPAEFAVPADGLSLTVRVRRR